MRFVHITCNIGMLEQMESFLRGLEINVHQVVPKALTGSNFDIPHEDTAVWPGFNACLLVREADASKGDILLERIREMNAQAYNSSELVATCLWSTNTYVTPESIMFVQECDPLSGT